MSQTVRNSRLSSLPQVSEQQLEYMLQTYRLNNRFVRQNKSSELKYRHNNAGRIGTPALYNTLPSQMEWRAPRLTKKVLGIEHCLQQMANQRQREAMQRHTTLNGTNPNQGDDFSNAEIIQTGRFSPHLAEPDVSANDASRESTQMADLIMLSERYQHMQTH